MATATTYIATPPTLQSCDNNYKSWKQLIRHWQDLSGLDPKTRASAIMLTLSGKALNAALQLPEADLKKEDGVDTLLKQLDTLYVKDPLSEKFRALESFETYRRPADLSINDFLIEYENKYFKIKEFGASVSNDMLGFRLIRAANLTPDKAELIKATVTDLTYDIVKAKMKQIFSDESKVPSSTPFTSIQQETFHASEQAYDSSEGQSNSDEEDTFFTNNKWRPHPRKRVTFSNKNQQHQSQQQRRHSDRSSSIKNWRSQDNYYHQDKRTTAPKHAKNSLDQFGNPTRCTVCESVNHWANNCPDRASQEKDTFVVHEIVLHASIQPVHILTLIAEAWGAGLVDCGASKTVCGEKWLEVFISCLSREDQSDVTYFSSNSIFRFGDGDSVQAKQGVKIPAYIGNKRVFIVTDIIEKDLPLLLSKRFLKNGKFQLDFDNDALYANGETIPLQTTHSGHYLLPLTKGTQLIHNLDGSDKIILTVSTSKSDFEIAQKLHRQFAHPTKDKLFKLVKLAGEPWNNNKNLHKEIENVTESCEICEKYKKAAPRPVVGLPMASTFLETVAIDIKFYNSKPILHLIDLYTKLSAAALMPNKQPLTVINTILKIWVSVYGATEKFLVDNGGEFANLDFINTAEKFGITVKTTAGYSPWSNGTVERHNQTLGHMLEKVLEEEKCDLSTAVSWCVSAKNSLHNVNGFTPFQLSIGTNPKLPSTLSDQLPSLSTEPRSKVLSEHLYALHKAREAFVESENSEKIRRALTHNVRSSGDIKYETGDSVYYKRDSSKAWHGPGKVLGQDGQQVLIKHGSYYIRVHPCRIRLQHQPLLTPEPSQLNAIPNDTSPHSSQTPMPSVIGHKVQDNISSIPRTVITRSTITNDNTPNIVDPQNSVTETRDNNAIGHDNDKSIRSTEIPMPCQNVGASHPEPHTSLPFKLQSGLNVKFIDEKGQSIKATLNSRAGKVKGLYPHWWNTTFEDGCKTPIDFSKVSSLEVIPSPPNSAEVFIANTKEVVKTAKANELSQWKKQNVYTEVDHSTKDPISLRWVCTPKVIDGTPSIKARLVAKGFQEQQHVRGDSPTCSREGVRIALAIIASNSWKLRSLDISTAFLQGGPINREVFVIPPKEAETDKIWMLNKAVYGLNDASRNWYLKLKEVLLSLGAKTMKLDQGIFCWYQKSNLVGLMVCFVDDILYGGDPCFSSIIDQLKSQFKVGTESESKLDYIGSNIIQNPDFSLTISQKEYVENLELIPLTTINTQNKLRPLADVEITILRGAIGQLNWLSGITRPEISFCVSEVSSRITSATVSDILTINKAIKFVKSTPGYITIPKLDLRSIKIVTFSDSSFNNLPNGNSQGAHIVFLADDNNSSCPVSWTSNKVKRVVKSTLAAETLAFSEGADNAYFIRNLLQEIILMPTVSAIPIHCLTDSQSLFETVGTSNQISDRRLRVEISAIREMIDNDEISIEWVSKDQQLSDVLTKKGASPSPLMRSLQKGSF